MARRARSPPVRAGSHTTIAPTLGSRLATTTSMPAETATSIVTTSRPACSGRRALAGSRSNDQRIEAGYRTNSKLVGWAKCEREISAQCVGTVAGSEVAVVVSVAAKQIIHRLRRCFLCNLWMAFTPSFGFIADQRLPSRGDSFSYLRLVLTVCINLTDDCTGTLPDLVEKLRAIRRPGKCIDLVLLD